MTNILDPIDQTPGQNYSMGQPNARVGLPTSHDSFSAGSESQRIGFDLQQKQQPPVVVTNIASSRSPSVAAHLAQGLKAVADFERSKLRAERHSRHLQALQWLSKNRRNYGGQWIALQGTRLLATAKTAKEVYSRVHGEQPPALVIKVETEELPFGGW